MPTGKNVADTIVPLSSIVETEAEIIEIIFSNYTGLSPYTMSVMYKLYFVNNNDAQDASYILNSVHFGSSISENLLQNWGNPSNIHLTVASSNNNFVTPDVELQIDEWAVAFLTFGCFIFLTAALVIILACLRSYFNKQYQDQADLYAGMISQSLRGEKGQWDMDNLVEDELVYTIRSDILQEQNIVEHSEDRDINFSSQGDVAESILDNSSSVQSSKINDSKRQD